MSTTTGTTKKSISFRNRQTGRSRVIPEGQPVRIRDTFAQGNAYTINTKFNGETYEANGVLARDLNWD